MNNQSNDQQREARRQRRKALWKAMGLSILSGWGGGVSIVKHSDERIAAINQRWAAWSGAFLSAMIGIDIFVRVVILRTSFPWEIAVIWLINMCVVLVGQAKSGVPDVGEQGAISWKTAGLILAGCVILVPALLWWQGSIHSWQEYLKFVLFGCAGGLVILVIMHAHQKRRERRTLGSDSDDENMQ